MDDLLPPTDLNDPLRTSLGFHLRRTSVAVMTTLGNELESLDLRPSDATLLVLVGANPRCTQSDISRALRAQPANLVPLINKLVVAGAIERQKGKGRAIALSLTAKGERLYKETRAVFDRHDANIARNIPEDLRAALIPALMRICRDSFCPD